MLTTALSSMDLLWQISAVLLELESGPRVLRGGSNLNLFQCEH